MKALLAGALCLCLAPQQGRDVCSVVPVPGGFADGDTAYLATSDSAIDAVDVRTGRTRWHSKVDGVPIGVNDQAVAAVKWLPERPDVMRILTLDSRSGAVRMASSDVELPPSVARARLAGGQMTLLAQISPEHVSVDWRAIGTLSHGANPGLSGALDSERTDGLVEIDGRTGRILSNVTGPPREPSAKPGSSMPYRRTGRAATGSWMVGGKTFTLTMSADRDVLAVSLGDGSNPVLLASGASMDAWVSPDGRAVFLRSGTKPSSPVRIFDVSSAREIGKIPYDPDAVDFSLACDRVFSAVEQRGLKSGMVPTLLKAFDLQGHLLWSHAIAGRPPSESALPR